MIKVDSHVTGLAELEQFLQTLPDNIAKKMLRSSLMGAAKPIMLQAQDNVLRNFGASSRYTGVLEAGIVRGRARTGLAARVDVRLKKPKKNDEPPKSGKKAGNNKGPGGTINGVKKRFGDDPFYGRWLELGRSDMAAKPFLKPAAMQQQDNAGTEFNKALQGQIEKWCKANGVKYVPGA